MKKFKTNIKIYNNNKIGWPGSQGASTRPGSRAGAGKIEKLIRPAWPGPVSGIFRSGRVPKQGPAARPVTLAWLARLERPSRPDLT